MSVAEGNNRRSSAEDTRSLLQASECEILFTPLLQPQNNKIGVYKFEQT
jgi:hypothetical protein